MSRMALIVVLSFLIAACNSELEDPPRYWDYNGDDIEDLSEEFDLDGFSHFEILDRNYDGKPDSRTQYDSARYWPVLGLTDDDFDGRFETRLYYKDAWVYAVASDSDGDDLYLSLIHI